MENMVIGLIRHFPVDFHFDRRSDSATFNRNMASYDTAPIVKPETEHDLTGWDVCYCSTMSRALKTADIIFKDKIVQTDLLREVPLRAGFHTKLKIPLFLWALLGRIQWYFKTRSQPENREMSLKRAQDFVIEYCLSKKNDCRILVVTHGFFMICLRKILKKKGFSGPHFLKPTNGRIYLFIN